jgi:hypothetical protein
MMFHDKHIVTFFTIMAGSNMDKDNPTDVDQSHDANANLPDSQ